LGLGVKPSEEALAAGGGIETLRGDLVIAALRSAMEAAGKLPEGEDSDEDLEHPTWPMIGEEDSCKFGAIWCRATMGPYINEDTLPESSNAPIAIDIRSCARVAFDDEDPTEILEQLQALLMAAVLARVYAVKAGIPTKMMVSFADPDLVIDLFEFLYVFCSGLDVDRMADALDDVQILSTWHALRLVAFDDDVREAIEEDFRETVGLEKEADISSFDIEAVAHRVNHAIEAKAEDFEDISVQKPWFSHAARLAKSKAKKGGAAAAEASDLDGFGDAATLQVTRPMAAAGTYDAVALHLASSRAKEAAEK